ncbi:hypothetical protein AX15_005560 [Amanita polypyramis BW_CC]|nr:hypothetical protein AX15_005560 [Amanita polypyramis BW_CC]
MSSSSLVKFEKMMKQERLKDVLFLVLTFYWSAVLLQTALKQNLIDLSTPEDIDKLIESLNDNEVIANSALKKMAQGF